MANFKVIYPEAKRFTFMKFCVYNGLIKLVSWTNLGLMPRKIKGFLRSIN